MSRGRPSQATRACSSRENRRQTTFDRPSYLRKVAWKPPELRYIPTHLLDRGSLASCVALHDARLQQLTVNVGTGVAGKILLTERRQQSSYEYGPANTDSGYRRAAQTIQGQEVDTLPEYALLLDEYPMEYLENQTRR